MSQDETRAQVEEAAEPQPAAEEAKRTVLITGFPGFLAKRLLRRLGKEQPENRYVLLVEGRFQEKAEQELRQLAAAVPALEGRWEVFAGDITDPQLGLSYGDYWDLASRVNRVWHFAAIYDLAVRAEVARAVNVDGTRHVLDFCAACTDFRCLYYVSTCYVSGDRTGVIKEDELVKGQAFKNHYESTKYAAEVEVQQRRDKVPSVVFRPAIVVGDSRTGETDKYDGPYYMIRLLMRMPRWLPMVAIGRGKSVINLVPVDFVVNAMAAISGQEGAIGKTFQLADPAPLPTVEGLDLILKSLGRGKTFGRVPAGLMDWLMGIRFVRRLLQMPRETVVYMNHDTRYDTTNTQRALEGTGVRCPRLPDYIANLTDYVYQHPEKTFLVRHEL